jgi:hypothetical protein
VKTFLKTPMNKHCLALEHWEEFIRNADLKLLSKNLDIAIELSSDKGVYAE